MSHQHAPIVEPDEVRLERAPGRTEYPLSFNQHEMWAQCQLYTGSSLNNAAVDVTLAGPLDVALFQRAFQAVVDRHDALRASFHAVEGTPVQRVQPVQAPVVLRDLSHVPDATQEEHVRALSEALARQPFALDRAPLLRAELVRLDVARHVFVLAFHHIIIDAFHLAQFLDELARTYERFVNGDGRPLPALPLQFGDFAVWEERALEAGQFAAHEPYWRSQLRAPRPSMAIPADRQPSSVRTFENGYVQFRLPRPLARGLAQLKARYRTTTFRTIAAAFQILLWRLTGESDVLLAMPMSTRPDACGDAVGFFANTLPVRVALDVDRPFHRLLAEVTGVVDEARVRCEFPLTAALRSLGVQRDPNRPPLPVCISQVRPFAVTAGGVHFEKRRVYAGASGFDLWLVVGSEGEDIQLGLHYASELFDESTIASFGRALQSLLASMAADPEAPIRMLVLTSPEERAEVDAWGDGGPSLADDDVVGAIVRVGARKPEAVAVMAGEARWTYAYLLDVAARLAASLHAHGTGPEARVGLLGARSPGMLATVLGVLRAGAAFVPLDASQPDARLQAIVTASALGVIVADRSSLVRARALAPSAPVLCWDDAADGGPVARAESSAEAGQAGAGDSPAEADQASTGDSPAEAGRASTGDSPAEAGRASEGGRPADLAYIFYTSGSTGTPKGVMVERRPMANHLHAKITMLGLGEASVVAQNAAAGFDIIVWQWLAPLLAGGRVAIYDEHTADEPASLLAALARDRVTVVETVPSFLEALLDVAARPDAPSLPALQWMISNAEALPPAVARRWLAQHPGVRLLNTCGATECADDTTHAEVTRSDVERARVPIGRPIPGVTVAVVDEHLRPVPRGCVGEIVYGGVPVGRGYVDDPAATARAFVPDARSAGPGARLYRTGDRGRWRTDGMLECLGRVDDQVKVRGYRVELGEVEAALATLPDVTQVAAAVRTDARGRRRLVAYYVAAAPHDPAVLRRALAARLPLYMVPDAWMWLLALPRTATGKLDRSALPAPPVLETIGHAEPPATPVEAAVAAVWQEVLQVSAVGRHDNFFDLGGDSIQSIVVASRLSQRGFRLSAREVFAHQTVAELAAIAERSPGVAPDVAPATTRNTNAASC